MEVDENVDDVKHLSNLSVIGPGRRLKVDSVQTTRSLLLSLSPRLFCSLENVFRDVQLGPELHLGHQLDANLVRLVSLRPSGENQQLLILVQNLFF